MTTAEIKKPYALNIEEFNREGAIALCKEVSEFVESILGPNGYNYLLEDEFMGEQRLCGGRDGIEALRRISTTSKMAEAILNASIEAAEANNKNSGDGTTTSYILFAKMFEKLYNNIIKNNDIRVIELEDLSQHVVNILIDIIDNFFAKKVVSYNELRNIGKIALSNRQKYYEQLNKVLSKLEDSGIPVDAIGLSCEEDKTSDTISYVHNSGFKVMAPTMFRETTMNNERELRLLFLNHNIETAEVYNQLVELMEVQEGRYRRTGEKLLIVCDGVGSIYRQQIEQFYFSKQNKTGEEKIYPRHTLFLEFKTFIESHIDAREDFSIYFGTQEQGFGGTARRVWLAEKEFELIKEYNISMEVLHETLLILREFLKAPHTKHCTWNQYLDHPSSIENEVSKKSIDFIFDQMDDKFVEEYTGKKKTLKKIITKLFSLGKRDSRNDLMVIELTKILKRLEIRIPTIEDVVNINRLPLVNIIEYNKYATIISNTYEGYSEEARKLHEHVTTLRDNMKANYTDIRIREGMRLRLSNLNSSYVSIKVGGVTTRDREAAMLAFTDATQAITSATKGKIISGMCIPLMEASAILLDESLELLPYKAMPESHKHIVVGILKSYRDSATEIFFKLLDNAKVPTEAKDKFVYLLNDRRHVVSEYLRTCSRIAIENDDEEIRSQKLAEFNAECRKVDADGFNSMDFGQFGLDVLTLRVSPEIVSPLETETTYIKSSIATSLLYLTTKFYIKETAYTSDHI